MPFVTVRNDPLKGDRLEGIFRTLVAAQAAAAAEDGVTALTDSILDADIPLNAEGHTNWWVRDIPRLNASVSIQFGASGKGFRCTFISVVLGAAGNDWTIGTIESGSGLGVNISAKRIDVPDPTAASAVLTTGAQLLAALGSAVGGYQLEAEYLEGTDATTDFSGLTGEWRPFPETDTENDPPTGAAQFSGGRDLRKGVFNEPLPLYTPRAMAAIALLDGLHAFREFVLEHAEGVDPDAVAKVNEFLRQKRRTCRMVYESNATLNGNSLTLTDAQFIAWATYCRFGPLDTSAVTALGEYNSEGLFEIFERADDPTVIDPTGPITWVGLDVTQWTNGTPNRLNVSEIVPVTGTAPSDYENVDDRTWLRTSNGN